jgi:hypothetical protein
LLERHNRASSSFAPHAQEEKQILSSRRFSPRQLTDIISGLSQELAAANALSISSADSDCLAPEAERLSGAFTRS